MRRHGDIIEDFMRVCENNRETVKAPAKISIFLYALVLFTVITGLCLVKHKRS